MALIPPTPVGGQFGSYTWQDWYNKVRLAINAAATISWSQITVFDPGGILPKTLGGTGTASPALVAGANIAVTGAWPNSTVAFNGVLPVANGGTGSATPVISSGSGITVTGTWPNYTIAVSTPYLPLTGGTMSGAVDGITNLTTTGNNILGNAVGDTLNVSANSIVVDASGNTIFGATSIANIGSGSDNVAINGTGFGLGVNGSVTTQMNFRASGFAEFVNRSAGGMKFYINSGSLGLTIDTSGNGTFAGGITTGSTTLQTTSVALSNGSGASVGTLNNAPAAGNPTKWISINDNGTVRKIPAW